MKIILPLYVAGALLFGSAYAAETVHTVDWYQKHSFARAETLRTCRDDPGRLGSSPNCVNSEKAEALHRFSSSQSVVFPKGTRALQGTDFDFSYRQ